MRRKEEHLSQLGRDEERVGKVGLVGMAVVGEGNIEVVKKLMREGQAGQLGEEKGKLVEQSRR